MRWVRAYTVVLAVALLAFAAGSAGFSSHRVSVHMRVVHAPRLTVYVRNFSPRSISNKVIRHDIPAWEKAANGAFARTWNTPQVQIRLVKRVPLGGISAYFISRGRVQGALAYHTVVSGVPHIVVYAGTGDYYGYNNSVSFTHELFEMLADPTLANLNYGYPEPLVWVGNSPVVLQQTVAWVTEVCDPVERYAYLIGNVHISDWITPGWFNDGMKGPLDYMGEASQPLQILTGGYAQFFDGEYHAIVNFRHAGADADGYLRGERLERQHS